MIIFEEIWKHNLDRKNNVRFTNEVLFRYLQKSHLSDGEIVDENELIMRERLQFLDLREGAFYEIECILERMEQETIGKAAKKSSKKTDKTNNTKEVNTNNWLQGTNTKRKMNSVMPLEY